MLQALYNEHKGRTKLYCEVYPQETISEIYMKKMWYCICEGEVTLTNQFNKKYKTFFFLFCIFYYVLMLFSSIGQIVRMEYFRNAVKIISNECLLDSKVVYIVRYYYCIADMSADNLLLKCCE